MNFTAVILAVCFQSSNVFMSFTVQLDNCCLHHKETLKKPEVASEVISAFMKKNVSVDQANKVCLI